MRGPAAVWIGATLLLAGCSGHNRHLVESELRAREVESRELREQLDCTRAHNQALQIELHSLRGDGPPPPPGTCLSDKPPVYPVCSLALGRQTGGHPSDHGHGDDALQVMLEPRDPEGHSVKVPGLAALIQAVEITSEGLKRPLCAWEVPPDQLRGAWRSGLLTTGYSLTLPWKVWPGTEKLRVVAQVRLPDGRAFEADKDVAIRITPNRPPQTLSPPAPTTPVLPAPTPVAPGASEGPVLKQTGSGKSESRSLWHAAEPEPAAELLRPVRLTEDK